MDKYDKDGNVIGLEEWASLMENRKYQRVASDRVDPYWVSTVWLGLDHRFGDVGPPLIFETMVFDEGDGSSPVHNFTDRYSTLEDAEKGHRAIVALLKMAKAGNDTQTGSSGDTS